MCVWRATMWQRPGTGALRSHVPRGEGMGGRASTPKAGKQSVGWISALALSIFQGERRGRGVTQKGGASRQSWSHRSAVPAGRLAMAVGMGVRSKEGHPRGDGDEEDNGCPCLMAKGMEGGKVIHRVSPLDRKSLQVSPGHSVQSLFGKCWDTRLDVESRSGMNRWENWRTVWAPHRPPWFPLPPHHRSEDLAPLI